MTNVAALILLAFAVSLDSFSVGFTYGLRKVTIPLASIVVIACMSAGTIFFSMFLGGLLSGVLSPAFAEKLGGTLLIGLGIWVIYQNVRPLQEVKEEIKSETVIATIEMKYFGIAINILRKPMEVDMDRSGTITGMEAVLLGIALSLDAFAAGLGAAMIGFSPIVLACCIGLMSSLFIKAGMTFGSKLSSYSSLDRLSFLPGVLLILIGIIKW
ncbi:MAG: sporulation membrane protein YtaF [Bacillus sp. (in: firmicutes)]